MVSLRWSRSLPLHAADNYCRKLETIWRDMNKMRKTTLFQRLLAKGEHATQLVDQRRALQDDIAKFQVGASLHTPIPGCGTLMDWSVHAADAVRPGGRVSDAHREETGRHCGIEHRPLRVYGRGGDRVAVRGGDTRTSKNFFF